MSPVVSGRPAGRLAPDLVARLEEAAGGPSRLADPATPIPGSTLERVVEPIDAAALAAVLRILDTTRTPAAILGAGTKSWLGNPLRETRLGLSTRGAAGIDELDAADGVVRVGAGTKLALLAEKVAAAGWALPLDPPAPGGTLGGALATALAGPRQLGFGPVRDAVLGLDVVLASGEHTRCGARVVKNVTGYDMAKLYVGSLGTLGVIERAWLRLRPVPESTRVVAAALDDEDAAVERALGCARRYTARAVSLVDASLAKAAPGLGAATGISAAPGAGADLWLVAELAGDAAATARDADWMADSVGAALVPDSVHQGCRALYHYVDPIGVRARLHVLPTTLAAVRRTLVRGGARTLSCPGTGSVLAFFAAGLDGDEDPWWLDRVLGVLDEARAAGRGQLIVEALPAWGHGRRDVFGGSEALSLMRALVQRFDPHRILNRGRYVGSI